MMIKIIFRNFRYNIKNYLLFFSREVLAVAMIFIFFALNHVLSIWSVGSEIIFMSYYYMQILKIFIVIVAGILLAYSSNYYLRTRVRDYRLFVLLGMKRKQLGLWVAIEFLLGSILSMAAGVGVGFAVAMGTQALMRYGYAGRLPLVFFPEEVYKYTLGLGVVVLIIAFFALPLR